MKYFKNTELAKLYNVSEKSVRNWIQAASAGKLDLNLFEENGKTYIANTAKNTFTIEQLALRGKKYKNTRAVKHIRPKAQLYELVSTDQILDLISNIEINREIPHSYTYLNGGAVHWDQYINKLLREKTPNALTNTIELLDLNIPYIDQLVSKHDGINVIDIGIGNGVPVKRLLSHLIKKGTLRRYIGIDVSDAMLTLARANMEKWFGSRINFEPYIRDISYERFKDITVSDLPQKANKSILNLVLFLGGTISNLRDPDHALRNIANSMNKDDILIVTKRLDTPKTRRFFDFALESTDQKLNPQDKAIPDLLGIDESYYAVEQIFDKKDMERRIQIRPHFDLSITFDLNGKEYNLTIDKDESILIWRARHQTMQEDIEQLDRNGFDILQATKSMDEQYLIVLSKIKQTSR